MKRTVGLSIASLFLPLICVWLVCEPIETFSQAKNRVGYTQLADDLFLNNNETVMYKNVYFYNDLPDRGAETFISTYLNGGAPETIYGGLKSYLKLKNAATNSNGLFISNCLSISIENCVFENDLRLSNMDFRGILSLVNNDFPTPSEDYVGLYGQRFGGAVLVDSSRFEGYFQLLFRKEIPYRFFFKFNNSEAAQLQLELQKSTSQIHRSRVRINSFMQIHEKSSISMDSVFIDGNFSFELDNIEWFNLTNSVVTDTTENYFDWYLNAEAIRLQNNQVKVNVNLGFTDAQLFLNNNQFEKNLTVDFNSIKKTSYVDLSSLKQLDIGIPYAKGYYNASTPVQLTNDILYKRYLRINKTLYDYFKEVGDIVSANTTYVRIREIENAKLKHQFDANPTFENFFALNLNRLLKFYTNYGTDPAKAMVISFYIIFIFGVFYFFFPSDWDVTSKAKLLQDFKDFIQKNDKGYVKPFLSMLIGFMMSIINATTLSLNAFTTLGFGNIPTHGLARYVCIIQGFIGWFLLSIFTVALINQAQF